MTELDRLSISTFEIISATSGNRDKLKENDKDTNNLKKMSLSEHFENQFRFTYLSSNYAGKVSKRIVSDQTLVEALEEIMVQRHVPIEITDLNEIGQSIVD